MSLESELSKTLVMIRDGVTSTASVSTIKETFHQIVIYEIFSNIFFLLIWLLLLYFFVPLTNRLFQKSKDPYSPGSITTFLFLSALACAITFFGAVASLDTAMKFLISPNLSVINQLRGN